ncbi:helix-turn-helix domain-containing protein [Epilithonimonas hungarica]|uniref:helix-turn-helix domain-containing protein n=1 Tax=Epilithonimonas hungarica TaxID=454006 RepID=UPI000A533094|nr:AraC family transcriptional regulator [Epilithonimonas hungarica]
MLEFYWIAVKQNCPGKVKYGQGFYDFDEGVMSFVSPKQLLSYIRSDDAMPEGLCLCFHPDFLLGYNLSGTIKEYGFFAYEINEALHLSKQEEDLVVGILHQMQTEFNTNIDQFSQDVIMAQLELLLQYSKRFYNRQFLTRKPANSELQTRLEAILNDYFRDTNKLSKGLPTVQYVAQQLHVSSNYLSDMLRGTTGQTTQQFIQDKLIEKAKELLSITSLSINEIAYQLGFEYAPSFYKLFKNKTRQTPLEYRNTLLNPN